MIRLDARSLAYKSGFMDGDVLDEVLWPVYGLGPDYDEEKDFHLKFDHEVLARLVEQHLLPTLKPAVSTYRIGTIHNPIRADELTDREALEYSSAYIEVPDEEVLRIAAEVWKERFGDKVPNAPKT